MPTPPTQVNEVPRSPVVRRLPRINEELRTATGLYQFVHRELRHWSTDLKDRQLEGALYLEWLDWPHDDGNEAVAGFQKLVQEELPILLRQIDDFLTAEREQESEMVELLRLQKEYVGFCDEYDRTRMFIIEEVDPRANFIIY